MSPKLVTAIGQSLILRPKTNHMAQGAATSMEDGAFLAKCLEAVIDRRLNLSAAISTYEKGRMPKASYKQQVSYLNGWLWYVDCSAVSISRNEHRVCG